ncbi:MAG: acetylglutamate kinase [archaeon]|nr:acetylglutamate kinase [archaeon]
MKDIFLLKLGGNTINDKKNLDRLSEEISELIKNGAMVVLVHGGGPEINMALKKNGITPKKVDGLRITDDATMKIVEETIKSVNTNVVKSLTQSNVHAVCVPGYTVTVCKKKAPYTTIEDGASVAIDLQNVGEVVSTNTEIIYNLLAQGITPVIYPIGADEDGRHLNINADSMASNIAAEIKCREMVQITDVPGIMLNIHDPSSKQSLLTLAQVDALISDGTISGGMIPKVEACRKALDAGVAKVRMVNGMDPYSIVSDIMKNSEHGTTIIK